MPTIEAEIDFSAYCKECGAGICNNVDVETKHSKHWINVTPCEKCLNSARDEGYDKGKKDGYDERLQEESDL